MSSFKTKMKSRDRNSFGTRQRGDRVIGRGTAIAAAVVIVLVAVQFFAPNAFASFFSYFFRPIWSGTAAISTDLTPKEQLVQENAALRQQLDLYEGQASSSKALSDQNVELKLLLGRAGGTTDLILADVLRRPPGAGYDYLVLDRGAVDAVSVGDPIYASAEDAIGQIVEVDAHTSKAELYSSSGTSYDILIGANHIPAVAVGQGGGSFAATVSR